MTLMGEPVCEGAAERGEGKCPLRSPDLIPSPAFAVFFHTPKFKEFLKYHQLAQKVHAAFYISNQIDISYIKSDRDTLPGSNSCLKGRVLAVIISHKFHKWQECDDAAYKKIKVKSNSSHINRMAKSQTQLSD